MNRIPPKSPGNDLNRRISINSLGSRPNSQAGFRNRLVEGSTFRKFSVLAHSKRQNTINDVTITQIEPDTSKDTRPLNRKSYQTQCIGELISYLKSQNYMVDIQRKDLNPASNKDFQDIFKFLYSKIDSNFVFKKRFEEEVPILLNQLMYPNSNNINKSHLSTVGTQHKWPTLLGVLHWLMKLAQAEDNIDQAQESENTVNYDDPAFNDIAYCQYAQHRFSSTLQGVDESEALENAESVLHNLLDQKFDIYDHENQQFEAEIQDLSSQLEQERLKPSLNGCMEQLATEKERADQFKSYLAKNNEYKQRYLEDENNRNLEYEKLEEEISELKDIAANLEETIENQELTQEEIHYLINERISLLTELEQIKMNHRTYESELEQLEEERKIKANDVIVELKRYNQLLEECGLVDDNQQPVQVVLDPTAEQRSNMLNYEPISDIEPNLNNLQDSFESTQISTKTKSVELQTNIQSIQVELEDLEFQKEQSKVEVKQKDEQFREEKERSESQMKSIQDQINQIHAKIKKHQPKTRSDVLNAQGEFNKIKNDVSKLQRDLDFQLEHLMNFFRSSKDQILGEFSKVFENLTALEDAAKEELNFTSRQAEHINQTEDAFDEFPLITPYKKRRMDLELS